MKRFLFCMTLLAMILPGLALAGRAQEGRFCFSPADFPDSPQGIFVTGISGAGSLQLGTRRIREGDALTLEQAGSLTFLSRDANRPVKGALSYLPVSAEGVRQPREARFSIRGRDNQAPVAEDSAEETYKNLPITGRLRVRDPEEDPMTFLVTREPRRGSVELTPEGNFTYTPRENKVGMDSFLYTARDSRGKVSRVATVTIEILKPSQEEPYVDTLGRSCSFAAEWMKHTGLFIGETLDGSTCFQPDKLMTRGEFLPIALKVLDISPEPELRVSAGEIPGWLRPYVAAALRAGLPAGYPFLPETGLTCQEAAALLGLDSQEADTPLTREQAACLLYRAHRERR